MPADEQFLKRWRRRRVAYNAGRAAFFAAVALYVGPNLLLFGKPTGLTPADFVPTVEEQCVPIVRAMKEFRRDHGRLPDGGAELMPDYHPPEDPGLQYVSASVHQGKFNRWTTMYNHTITYDFEPATEGWYVTGAFTHGRIPLPPVTIDPRPKAASGPATEPASRPTSGPAGRTH